MPKQYQVIVVGGGPVGVALAIELGMRGVSCALIERRFHPQQIPKGQNLTQRTFEHFYFWGIADELRAARTMPRGFSTGDVLAYRSLTTEYWRAFQNVSPHRTLHLQIPGACASPSLCCPHA